MRRITRTYYSKKLGRNVTKTYTYNSPIRASKGGTLVYKSGKINEKVYRKTLDDIERNLSVADKYEFKAIMNRYIGDKEYKHKRLTVRSVQSMMAESKIEKAIINFGYDVDDLLIKISSEYNEPDLTREWLYDPNHWNGEELILPSGQIVNFEFDYQGGVLL